MTDPRLERIERASDLTPEEAVERSARAYEDALRLEHAERHYDGECWWTVPVRPEEKA